MKETLTVELILEKCKRIYLTLHFTSLYTVFIVSSAE